MYKRATDNAQADEYGRGDVLGLPVLVLVPDAQASSARG